MHEGEGKGVEACKRNQIWSRGSFGFALNAFLKIEEVSEAPALFKNNNQ